MIGQRTAALLPRYQKLLFRPDALWERQDLGAAVQGEASLANSAPKAAGDQAEQGHCYLAPRTRDVVYAFAMMDIRDAVCTKNG